MILGSMELEANLVLQKKGKMATMERLELSDQLDQPDIKGQSEDKDRKDTVEKIVYFFETFI